ncbi:CoxG family protein [Aquibacillus kalidii]|uniref:CoxG family protein n=1 Tax=Aquibacillus kalidii TaxID=2762597 RepID=UPI001645D62A|nr:SRPBCC family protein [Aquibacillus kalidii]
MPSGSHQVEVNASVDTIWDFVSDMNKWAPLVPGYVEHTILSENQSTWKFKGDVGVVKKTVSLQIDITEWQKPNKVMFNLKGLNENFVGKGFFEAEVLSETTTKMTGNLDITAKGMLGPMANNILRSFLPKTTVEFTDAIANKLTRLEPVTK